MQRAGESAGSQGVVEGGGFVEGTRVRLATVFSWGPCWS